MRARRARDDARGALGDAARARGVVMARASVGVVSSVVSSARGDARRLERAMMGRFGARRRRANDDRVRVRVRARAEEEANERSWATPRPFVRARRTPMGKRRCERCDGFGERACGACGGSGRVNRAREGGMFERGAWPRWCGDCRGCGACACGDCFGTGAHRDPIGFRLGDD